MSLASLAARARQAAPAPSPATCLLALLLSGACTRTIAPPAVFPARTAWTAAGDDALEPPLAADEVRVFAAGRAGSVRALDRLTGNRVWSLADRPGVLSAAEGLLVLRQADGTVWGLDPASGTTRWQVATTVVGLLPATISERRVVVAGAGAVALDAADGKRLWSGPEDAVAAAPATVFGPWVLLGMEDGTLRCLDSATGAPLWSYASGSALRAAPAVDGGSRVLLGTSDRRVVALRADKGGQERWRWKVGGDVRAAPVVYGPSVLVASYDAVLYGLNSGNGHMAWRAPLPSRPVSGPLLFGSAVLVACLEKDILGFDARTGRQLGGLATPSPLHTSPLIVDDWLYAGLRDRSIVAWRLARDVPSPDASPSSSRSRRRPATPSPAPSPAQTPPREPSPAEASPAEPSPNPPPEPQPKPQP